MKLFPVFLTFICVLAVQGRAADFPPVNPDELKVTSIPEQPGAPAVILYREDIADDMLHFQSVYMRIKILTEAGRKYADVQVPYNRNRQDVSEFRGRTIHPDGTIINFEGKPYEKVVWKTKDRKIMVKSFSLPDAQVGSIIEYRYYFRYDDNIVFAPRWIVQHELFERKAHFWFKPTNRDVVDDDGKVGGGVAWTSRLPGNQKPQFSRDHFEFDVANVPAFVEEPNMPPADNMKYSVFFYYQTSARTREDFWKQQGKSWNKRLGKFMGRRDGVAQGLTQVIAPGDTTEAKVRKIYDYVSTFENTTYSASQKTGLDGNLKINNGVDDVIRNKSGNRTEITRTFAALVQEAGIPAYLMAVSDRTENLFEPQFLSWDQLDAEIAIVSIDGNEVFLDPGTKFAPFGLLNWHYTASGGIRQAAKGTAEAQTPPPSYKDAIIQRLTRVTMNDNGDVTGTLKVTYKGQSALAKRIEGATTDEVGKKKILEDEVKEWLPANAEVEVTNKPEWEKAGAPLVAEFKISTPILTSAGKRGLLSLNFYDANQRVAFAHTQRSLPIIFSYPTRVVDQTQIVLPPSISVQSVPPQKLVQTDLGYYKTVRGKQGSQIIATRDFAVLGFAFAATEYPQLKSFYDQVKAADDEQAVLVKVAADAQGN